MSNKLDSAVPASVKGGAHATLSRIQENRWPSGLKVFALYAVVLTVLFMRPLSAWGRLVFHDELYSHAILMPFIAAYLIWLNKKALCVLPLPVTWGSRPWIWGVVISVIGCASSLFPAFGVRYGLHLSANDSLAFSMLAFVGLIYAGGLVIFGARILLAVALPAALLLFMVPFPTAVEHGIEMFFQYTSADAASVLFSITGTPFLRDGRVFQLPGIVIQVAQECSGIRSSMVLFITSLIAGYMFLKSPWKRTMLALFVIPLGILRNGFRIMTIGLLCVHISPEMIHHPIHHKGGPVFFVLSLIPFFLLLWWLRRREIRGQRAKDV